MAETNLTEVNTEETAPTAGTLDNRGPKQTVTAGQDGKPIAQYPEGVKLSEVPPAVAGPSKSGKLKPDDGIDLLTVMVGDNVRGEIVGDIRFVTEDYIVFYTNSIPKSIRYYYTEDRCGKYLNKIQKDITKLIALLKLNKEFEGNMSYIAATFSVCMAGDPNGALELINALYQESVLGAEIRRAGKVNYLVWCLLGTIAAIFTCLKIKYNVTDPIYASLVQYAKVAAFGCIGGYISIAIKVSTTAYNFDKSKFLQILSAVSRLFISIFSAVAIYTIIESRLALAVFADANNKYLFYSFAVLSGFSETFIPDVFDVLQRQTTEKLSSQQK